MIVQYLDYFVFELLPELFQFLDILMIADGVSLLELCIAIILLGVVIGAILMRV